MRMCGSRLIVTLLVGIGLWGQKPRISRDIRGLEGWVSAKDYGCVADNVFDDTTCIKNALAASGVFVVYLPPGTYKVTPDVTGTTFVLGAKQQLVGAGPGATIIRIGVASISPQGQALIGTAAADTGVRDLAIDGNGMTTIQAMIYGLDGHSRMLIDRVRITNSGSNLACIVLHGAAPYSKITNTHIDGGNLTTTNCHGIRLSASTNADTFHQLSNITVTGGNFALYLLKVNKNTITNFTAIGDGTPINTETLEGVNINESHDNVFENIMTWSRGDAGIVLGGGTAVSKRNLFSNIVSALNCLDGLHFTCADCRVNNAYAYDNGVCTTAPSERSGIHVISDATLISTTNRFVNVKVSNEATTNQQWGIRIDEGAVSADNNFFDYDAAGNTTAAVLIGAGVTGTMQIHRQSNIWQIDSIPAFTNRVYVTNNDSFDINFRDAVVSPTLESFIGRPTGTNDLAFKTSASGTLKLTIKDGNPGGLLFAATVFANLGTPANGTLVYCSDCAIANPCTGSGTGAFAKRLNSVWVCN